MGKVSDIIEVSRFVCPICGHDDMDFEGADVRFANTGRGDDRPDVGAELKFSCNGEEFNKRMRVLTWC